MQVTTTGPEMVYSAPPIIEAIIQLSFTEPLADALMRKLVKRLAHSYKNEAALEEVSTQVDFQTRTARFEVKHQTKLSSSDQADILLVHPTALTWSRLAPYQGWSTLIARVREDITTARTVVGYRRLSRIGVRYINRIDVPRVDGTIDFESYLAIKIDLPETIPTIQNYAWRFEHRYEDQNVLAIVQSAIVEPEVPNTGAFVIDIDIVALHDLPVQQDDILQGLEEMRKLKNTLFEACILDKARGGFS